MALTFANLNTWAGASCATWGQPAIMVTNQFAPPGQSSGSTYYYAYLAAACFDEYFQNTQGYYVFWNSIPFGSTWTKVTGPFTVSSISGLSGFPSYASLANFITEFDWFMRPDGSVGAVVTPQYIESPGSVPIEYGCVAANFNPVAGINTNPFTTGVSSSNIIATIYDQDTQSTGPTESQGPGSCTYEPTSNQGVVFVRRLNGTPSGGVGPYQIYDLVDSGIMP